jgi:hypothetical protein
VAILLALVVLVQVVRMALKQTVMQAVVRTKATMFLVLVIHVAEHLKVLAALANLAPL